VGWDGEGRERKGEEGRDGKRAGGKYCFMAVGGDGRHCGRISCSRSRSVRRHNGYGSLQYTTNMTIDGYSLVTLNSPVIHRSWPPPKSAGNNFGHTDVRRKIPLTGRPTS
jgi:hypothetical protein